MSPRPRPTDPSVEPTPLLHPSQPTLQLTGSSLPPEDERGHDRRFDVSVPQILAGALATAAAALAASSLGVAGTVLGAVVMSVVASISTALVIHPIQRSTQAIRETLPIVPDRSRPANDTGVTDTLAMTPMAPAPQAASTIADARREFRPLQGKRRYGGMRWPAVAVSSLATLMIGFAVLTGLELVVGQSAGSLTGSNNQDQPTLARLVETAQSSTDKQDLVPVNPHTPSVSEVDPPREPASPTAGATPPPTGSEPSEAAATENPPTEEPSEPSAPTEDQPSEPEPSEPEPSEPAPSEPEPSEPELSEPAPPEPEPSESKPSAPAPSQPAPLEP